MSQIGLQGSQVFPGPETLPQNLSPQPEEGKHSLFFRKRSVLYPFSTLHLEH